MPVPIVGQGAGCTAAAAQVLVLAASLEAAGLPVLLSTSSLRDQPWWCLGQPWSSSRQCPAAAQLFAGAQQEQAAGADTAGATAPFPACPSAQDSAATLVPRVPGFPKPFSGCWRPSAPGNPGGCTQTLGLRCSGMPAGRAACGGGSTTQLSGGIPRAAGWELGLRGVSLAPAAALSSGGQRRASWCCRSVQPWAGRILARLQQ